MTKHNTHAAIQPTLETDLTIDIITTDAHTRLSLTNKIWFCNMEGTVIITGRLPAYPLSLHQRRHDQARDRAI